MSQTEMTLAAEARQVLFSCVESLKTAGHLPYGAVVVLGCSTSEVVGQRIGQGSVPTVGAQIAEAFVAACQANGLQTAFQCCEHLNRALVIEKKVAEALRLEQVWAIPQPKAGGSVPAAAWRLLNDPALVRCIQADAAIDVGDTLVGMHIRPVAVPLRGEYASLGQARVVMAYSRLPLIGGERAVYK